jgi:chitosanase
LQHQKFDMLVAMGENDTFAPAYAYAEDIGDGRGYTCGKVGFCTGSGDAILVARCYEDARPSNVLSAYWPGLVSINDAFFATGANQASTKDIDKLAPRGHRFANTDPSKRTGGDWAAAAQDGAFTACQDSMADALYLSLAIQRARALHLSAPLTIGFLYDTELNFGEEDEDGNPGTATLVTQSLADYQKTYGKPFPSQPTPTDEQMLLGCIIFERTYDMASNSTWKKATDQDATWEAARRTGNMDMSRPITSQYRASFGKGACWASLPSNVDSKYAVYTVETDPGDPSRAKGTKSAHQEKMACPPDPFAKCHR